MTHYILDTRERVSLSYHERFLKGKNTNEKCRPTNENFQRIFNESAMQRCVFKLQCNAVSPENKQFPAQVTTLIKFNVDRQR